MYGLMMDNAMGLAFLAGSGLLMISGLAVRRRLLSEVPVRARPRR